MSSCSSSRAMSNNGFSYLLRKVLVHSGASSNDVAALNAHSICGIATSSAFFFRNWSLASVLEASFWRSNTVFTSFYLKDVYYIFDNVHSLGPLSLQECVSVIVFRHVSAFIHVMRRLTIVEDSGMALTWWVNFNL